MNESNIRLAIFYIPPVVAATIFLIKWQSARIAANKEIATLKVKEQSVGQTAVEKLTEQLKEAQEDREELRQDLKEMKADFKYFKEEIRIMIEAIRKHGIEEINETISAIKKLKQ